MCVPWELNPQPFALQTQCSTTEPQEQSMESRSTIEDFGSKKEKKKKKGPYFLVQFAGLTEVFIADSVAGFSPWLWGKELLSCSMTSSNPMLASWEGLDSSSSPETHSSEPITTENWP